MTPEEIEDYDGEVCDECKEPCTGQWTDQDIGAYEFQGRKGVDTRMGYLSDCCEADVLENGKNLTEDPPDDSGDRGDWKYEQKRDREMMERERS